MLLVPLPVILAVEAPCTNFDVDVDDLQTLADATDAADAADARFSRRDILSIVASALCLQDKIVASSRSGCSFVANNAVLEVAVALVVVFVPVLAFTLDLSFNEFLQLISSVFCSSSICFQVLEYGSGSFLSNGNDF